MSVSRYIVYGLVDPDTNLIRYIGKSMNGLHRPREHFKPSSLKNDGNTPKANWIRKLKSNGQNYQIMILFNLGDSNFDKSVINKILYKKEQELINYYNILGYELLNLTDGGPGCVGRPCSEDTRRKMSEIKKKAGIHPKLKENQKPKFDDPTGKRTCSICLETKELQSFKSPKSKSRHCKSCFNKNRKSRAVPGAKESFIKKLRIPVIATNPITNEEIKFSSFSEATKFIGKPCNKLGIRNSIKNNKSYYNYFWSLA